MQSKFLFIYAAIFLIGSTAFAQKPTEAETLIRKMHKKYNGKFNENITFVQLNQDFDATGKVKHSMSFETFHYPGKFRNDVGPGVHKDGYIIIFDTMYIFKNGKITEKKYTVYDVGLLTGDIYFMPVEDALKEIKRHGYDITKSREDTWRGKPVYVIGSTDKNDVKSPQFWIDSEELYIVRNINFSVEDNELEDIWFLEHARVENAWVEERVEIYVNGKLVKKEHYAEVKANNELDLSIFSPRKLGTIHWRPK